MHMMRYKVWGSDFLLIQRMHWPVMHTFVPSAWGSFPATTNFGIYGSEHKINFGTTGFRTVHYYVLKKQKTGVWYLTFFTAFVLVTKYIGLETAVFLLPVKNVKYTALEEAYLLGPRFASSSGTSLVGFVLLPDDENRGIHLFLQIWYVFVLDPHRNLACGWKPSDHPFWCWFWCMENGWIQARTLG